MRPNTAGHTKPNPNHPPWQTPRHTPLPKKVLSQTLSQSSVQVEPKPCLKPHPRSNL